MKDHHALRAKTPARSSCRTRFSVSSRARISSSAACTGSSPSVRPARTRPRAAPKSGAPARRCTSRRAPAAPVTVRPACRSSAAAAAPSARSFAAMRPICRRRCARWRCACAVGQGQGRRLIVIDNATLADAKTKALVGHFAGLGFANALVIDGAEVDDGFASRGAQHSEYRRAAGAGHQRLRHSAPREARADQGRGRCAGGALQMKSDRSAPLRRHRRSGDHREGDDCVRAQQGRLQGRARRRPSRRSRKRSRSCSTSR